MFQLLKYTDRKKKSEYLQKKINERETYILMTGIDYREILNMMNSAYEQSNPTKKRAFKWMKIKLPIDFGLKKIKQGNIVK